MELQLNYSYQVGTPTRESIMSLQQALADLPDAMGEEEMEERYNTHYFAPGVYGRVMFIPKDMCVVGKIHKHAHLNVVTRGKVKVVTEFGEDVIEGPRIWVSEPGTKRAVYALEDTEWMTVHHNPTETRDIREIENEVIAPTFEDYDRLRIEQGSIV